MLNLTLICVNEQRSTRQALFSWDELDSARPHRVPSHTQRPGPQYDTYGVANLGLPITPPRYHDVFAGVIGSPRRQTEVSFALPPWSRFHRLSCEVRPVGRGLTFVPGDVATRIRTITIRPSLLPTSQTRTAKDRPCGLSSPKGAIRGFDVPSV